MDDLVIYGGFLKWGMLMKGSMMGKSANEGNIDGRIIWRLPKMGGTPKPSMYRMGFSMINEPAIGVPTLTEPPYDELNMQL